MCPAWKSNQYSASALWMWLTRPVIHRRPISEVAAASPGIEPHLSDELPTSGVF
jgi:hypothetical protein